MKKNRKKKLPRYWLGTRMPTSLGYQPNQGIGNVSYSTTRGENFMPEANAATANILPSAINRLQQSTTPLLNMFQNTVKSAASGATALGSTASAMTAANSVAAGGVGARLAAGGTADYMGSMFAGTPAATSSTGSAAGSAGATVGRTALTAAGKALGIIGSAYGAANMVMDFIHNKDHRTAGDMLNTLTENTYTTDKGNKWTEYTGLNSQAERKYERAQHTSRNINNTINAAGTGAAIGSVIAPGIGTLIGGLGGALYGGLSALFGFGDNSEEIEYQMKNTQDIAALKTRQSKAAADSADVNQGFYDRFNQNGRVGAALGKKAVYGPEGLTNKKATAKVSNGEVIGNFEDGYVSRVPGEKNNKDTKFANLKNSDFVISNKFGLSDYAAATGDYVGALKMQDMLMKQYKKNYKCGKLPKCVNGWGDYALSTLPHLGSALVNLMQYNKAKNASVDTLTVDTETPEADAAINRGLSERIDPRYYLNMSQRNLNQAAWNARRAPGMGLGGRMVMLDSLARAKQAQDAETLFKIDKANRDQVNHWLDAKVNLGKFKTDKRIENQWKSREDLRQAVAARDYYANRYLNNTLTAGVDAAADALKVNQFHKSQDYQDKLLSLYNQQLNLDALKAGIDLKTGKPIESRSSASKYVPETDRYMKLTNPFTKASIYPQYQMYKAPTLTQPYIYPYFKVNWP